MRRKETLPPVRSGGRDDGKVFVVTEWPAARAEKWGMRAVFMLRGSGASVPMGIQGLSMTDVAILGMNAFFQANFVSDEAIPLLDELLECVTVVRDPKHPDVETPFTDPDAEEIGTRLWLRSEVLRVHTGFSPADALSNLLRLASAKLDLEPKSA